MLNGEEPMNNKMGASSKNMDEWAVVSLGENKESQMPLRMKKLVRHQTSQRKKVIPPLRQIHKLTKPTWGRDGRLLQFIGEAQAKE